MEAQQRDGTGGGVFVGFGFPVAGNAGEAALGFAIGGSDSSFAAGLFEALVRRGGTSAASATWALF